MQVRQAISSRSLMFIMHMQWPRFIWSPKDSYIIIIDLNAIAKRKVEENNCMSDSKRVTGQIQKNLRSLRVYAEKYLEELPLLQLLKEKIIFEGQFKALREDKFGDGMIPPDLFPIYYAIKRRG